MLSKARMTILEVFTALNIYTILQNMYKFLLPFVVPPKIKIESKLCVCSLDLNPLCYQGPMIFGYQYICTF